jgi:hypothetical protein
VNGYFRSSPPWASFVITIGVALVATRTRLSPSAVAI